MQLSVQQAAAFLNVSVETVHKWVQRDAIPAHRVGGEPRFIRAELLEWATSRNLGVSPALFRDDAAGAAGNPSLADALAEGGVFHRVPGRDQPSVLRAVVESLRLPDTVDRAFLLDVLLAREAMGSTGIGDGIAVPHVRNPVVLHVPTPSVTLSFLEHAIDFGAVDGQPVDTLFTLVSPTIKAHLSLLSRIGFVLRDSGVRSALKRRASEADVIAAVATAEVAADPRPGSARTQ